MEKGEGGSSFLAPGSGKVEHIPGLRPCFADSSGCQLDNGIRRETSGHAPGHYVAADFLHSLVTVYIHKIDCEAHAESMHSFAGNDP